ncbi:hypothetical protein HYALB_00012493 [Hymenoscyphus albidus]|uniref:Uncharacterized protein n=1 Tax=Hymenoscyphus albidus TaxID=595503 RepID=A0A9N9PXD0_9HELO|nr:hypothetical protein HYALB_00012493 [Hymenoscyphus albidus]
MVGLEHARELKDRRPRIRERIVMSNKNWQSPRQSNIKRASTSSNVSKTLITLLRGERIFLGRYHNNDNLVERVRPKI